MKDILEKEIQISDLYPPTNVVRTGCYVTNSNFDPLTLIREFLGSPSAISGEKSKAWEHIWEHIYVTK